MSENRKALKKTLSWTTFATAVSTLAYYLSTGSLVVVPVSVILNAVVFPISYFLHERIWERKK